MNKCVSLYFEDSQFYFLKQKQYRYNTTRSWAPFPVILPHWEILEILWIFSRFKRKTLFALALIGQSCSRGTRHFSGNDLHFANFISDLRRKKQALWAPIPEIFKTEQILRCSQIQFRISTLARFQLWICCREKIYKSNSVSFFATVGNFTVLGPRIWLSIVF